MKTSLPQLVILTARWIVRPVVYLLLASAAFRAQTCFTLTASAASWPMQGHDAANTGRASFVVPTNRMGTNFFDALRWQKRSPGSPNEGNLGSSPMVFFDGSGPGGADLVVSGYHWPKGVQGMDRHTGKFFWAGNPDGGESIGDNAPAFSTNGQTLYVINDATLHPLMGFSAASGPSQYWHNGADSNPDHLGAFSPKVVPDGRIFAHGWDDRPYAAADSGTALSQVWSAESSVCAGYSCPAIWSDANSQVVVSGGRCNEVKAWDGSTGTNLWAVSLPQGTDASPSVDPANGHIYLPVGFDDIWVTGIDKHGNVLWSSAAMPVFDYQNGINHPQRAQSGGCLAHDGQTYYFQTVSQEGDGQLYAINTTNGSVKWSHATGSKGWERQCSSPIVTPNGVLVIGNNEGGVYFALRDDGTNATLLDTLQTATNGLAASSATLSPDGLLYLPARLTWTQSNGDGETPSQQVENLFNAFDLTATALSMQWSSRQRDVGNTGRADFRVPTNRMGSNFFNALRWQKRTPNSPNEGNLGSSAMVFYDGVGPDGAGLVAGGYHWPKGVQGMDRHTGKFFWAGNPDGGESIGDNTPAFSPNGQTLYVINDATEHPLMAFSPATGPSTYWHNAGADGWKLGSFSPKAAPDGRIFAHAWDDRPYAGTDSGSAITLSWSASSSLCAAINCPALWQDANRLVVISAGRCGLIKAWHGTTGAELWSVDIPEQTDADATVDPANGNVYVAIGSGSIAVVGLDKSGATLWSSVAMPVFQWQDGVNHAQRAQSGGCLAHDGQTYYFQTVSQEGDGKFYAINTSDGSVKWSYATGSKGWEQQYSSPIVTPNGVVVIGNNEGGVYFALRDDGTNATLLATLPTATTGLATSSATLSPDGLLYLPARLNWIQGNGDGEAPTQQTENLFNAFDLNAIPQITLPPPAGQRGRPLNGAVELAWTPIADPSGQFSHYAIYRAAAPFTSVVGLTPIATVSNRLASGYTDSTAVNGTTYYYFVTAVSLAGRQATTISSIGGFLPFDETDVQVVSISRTPRYQRYAAQYTGYEITEPSGFGPYFFSAATGLGSGQTTNTQRWPATNDPVTYTATVRNRGSNPWTNVLAGVWQWDGTNAGTVSAPGPFAPGALTTFTLVRPWDGASHQVRFSLTNADARADNNSLSIDTKSVAFLTFMDEGYYQAFRSITHDYTNAVTDDLIDWLNRHMARFNQMFAAASCAKRVHFDVLELLPDLSPDPAIDTLPFAIFPFRYHSSDGDARLSGYYRPDDDIDYGLLHEMGHQLGLIDIYQLDLAGEANLVSGQGYTGPDCLMRGVSPFLSQSSALAMNHWLDQVHGYFGQYLYGIPSQVRMRFLSMAGEPLRGATVKMYQLEERPGLGKIISRQIKAQGTTDTNGYFTLPNVPIDPAKVPPLPTGDALHDNPFGYVAVVGANGVMHFRVEHEGSVDYSWLDITEANVAYYTGQTNLATFERHVALGGPIQWFPPTELTETNAADWAAWAEGGANGGSTTQDDTVRKQTGATSLKFVTDGGFDTYVRYPGTFNARWNLTPANTLRMSIYAENPNFGFQSASPWIRLKDTDGNYFQYQFYQDGNPIDALNNAMDAWWPIEIPLRASATETNGWRRTTFGTPDLSRIQFLEIHADTWGYGFTLWIDGVSFDPPLRATLQLTPQSQSIVLTWPVSNPALALEAANEVTGPYLPVAQPPVETNGAATVSLPFTGERRFFRLKMP